MKTSSWPHAALMSLAVAIAVPIDAIRAAEATSDPKTHCFDGGSPFRIGMQICPSRGLRLLCLGVEQRYWMGKIHHYGMMRDGPLRFDKAHWVEFAVSPGICPAQTRRPIRFR